MSDIFRKAVIAKLPNLPPTRAPWAEPMDDDDDEEIDYLGELDDALPPLSTKSYKNLTPLSAKDFFSQALEVTPGKTTFRVYLTPPILTPETSRENPLSGKGRLEEQVTEGDTDNKGTYLICHHGAGSSGLSFAMLAKEVKERGRGELGVMSFDCRGHGKTRTDPVDEENDLSTSTLLSDFVSLIQHLFPNPIISPSLLLMGHSMGAAPILASAPILQEKGYKVVGVIVLDVVEGTAVEALPLMKGILSKRPQTFPSVIDAIHWHLVSNSIRNSTSARISVPSYLIPLNPGEGQETKQKWRTDLISTEPFWSGWYENLSSKFLTSKCARLLVLAGQERLDKELMVGQMQGKFQLEVMQDVGHYLHEDDPTKLANIILAFWKRNTRMIVLPGKIGSKLVGVRRVGEE
ncbi:hypothetical protein TREMEDRAFT_28267 [Tremella mesenterica DSM 1558]|uniref:uncharacterized protein n=1 Tax=Tremella mesenterica (strain ATCC 24925 / CBS 8224 / DSM 1558 / NBRC 9311 / NRRL Y-6157 / RJB 2259-6 / UBC 559-6) TaxID=578456 RepID=UPI0003F4A5DD|nr:uncharacterized protein TREMEDRAFT_28267 [Tremella mesenterica DSM 1558]EIW71846.1 hypothetical protein TREMEDRAFT_28267 [Tremella mesenterica DSM 1558]